MKKILSASPIILCMLYAFLPICKIVGAIYGYQFALTSYPISAVVLSIVSLAAAALMLIVKVSVSKAQTLFSAIALPLSAINGLFFIFETSWSATIIFMLLCCGCGAVLLVNYVHAFTLKVTSMSISILLMILLLLCAVIDIDSGDFVSFTVEKSATSPQNTYTAEVIYSDQGALGGNTLVEVYNNTKSVNLLFCEFTKPPIRVYAGELSEYQDMQISWENEHILVINGSEYSVAD